MLKFELKRSKKGKRSRWSKKYPRKRISHRGDEKYAHWFPYNWTDDKYTYLCGDIEKFLMANLFRPVDKVFSEFLQRCRKGTEIYNLREKFYNMFKNKEDIKYGGGFYLSNGIINFKKGNLAICTEWETKVSLTKNQHKFNKKKRKSMKTILVVYTNTALTAKQISDRKMQKYVFRTEEDFKEGDLIKSRAYSDKMQVVDVIDSDYKYYNSSTGELRNDINSTRCYPIKKIVLREDDELTVYAAKCNAE